MKKQSPDQDTDSMLTAALQYAERGWRVFPNHKPTLHEDGTVTCSCGETTCKPGKHPRLGAWQKQATTKPSLIRPWWKKFPDTNVGIATGWDSDLLVLDVDAGHGLQHLAEWERQGKRLPATATVETGGGGFQFYFHFPDLDFEPKTRARLCGNHGIDVRANGGQVVAPPSLHPSGNHYRWADGRSPDDVAVVDPPEWLIEMLRCDGRPLTQSRPPRLVLFDEMPPPDAHVEFLHPHLNPNLVTTATGQLRRGLDGSLKKRWQTCPEEFATERRLIAAIGDLWLPPEVRPWLENDGVTLMCPDDNSLDYLILKPGDRCPQKISGGRWVSDGKYNKYEQPVTSLTQTFRLLLGQRRLLVPWDQRVDRRGNRRRRDTLDTLLVPVKVWAGPRDPVDVWAAEPAQRRKIIKPIASALEALTSKCSEPTTFSFWAEGINELWIAIHASERLSVDELLPLQQGIIDMAAENTPEVCFFGERRRARGNDAPVLMYEVGLGNLGNAPCPLPFSFHTDHPDRMMMALDPDSGEFHDDQVAFLISLQRRSDLGALLSTLGEVQSPSVRAAAARWRVVTALNIGDVADPYLQLKMNVIAQPNDVHTDWEIYTRWRDADEEPLSTGHDALNEMFGHKQQSDIGGTMATDHVDDNVSTTHVEPDRATDGLSRHGWQSRLPQDICGLYSIMIGSGALARVLAVMRDDGLLKDAVVGQGVLQELEDEVVRRYTGSAIEANLRQELQEFIRCALADVDNLFDAAMRLSAPRKEQVRKLAQTLYELLPTRGSGERPATDEIAALLESLAIKSEGQRQAQWTLDFIAIKAGWAEEVGDGTSRISAANRQRISRFMRRICQDYYRYPGGDVREDAPPLLPLIRCDRKGHQGIASRYTFLWEHWGDAFSDLCQTPCPPRPGEPMTEAELIAAGLLERRSDKASPRWQ